MEFEGGLRAVMGFEEGLGAGIGFKGGLGAGMGRRLSQRNAINSAFLSLE